MEAETLSQARHWDKRKSRYVAYGLCHRCAAQAAWGHQCGFNRVAAPCDGCAPIVARVAPYWKIKGTRPVLE